MSTKARLGIDITAADRTRAAFASANRNLTALSTNINGTIRGIKQFRGAFVAAFAALGVKAGIEAIGRAVDKNLVDKAGAMQSRWSTTWDAWGNTADRIITEAAMGLDGIITDSGKALGLIDQIASQSVNRAGMGNAFPKAPLGFMGGSTINADFMKGQSNNVTNISKTADAIQGVNRALKENAVGYKAAEKASRGWTFKKDVLADLDAQVALIEVQNKALREQTAIYNKSSAPLDAYLLKQEAINEILKQGQKPTADQIRQIDKRAEAVRKLVVEQETLIRSQSEIAEMSDSFKDAFSGLFQSIAQGTSVVKALKDELASLGQRLLQMATDKIFELAMNYLFMSSQQPGGSILQLPQFASGGTLGAGKWGIAGEAGPELIEGPARITPFSKLGGGDGGPSIKIINNNGSQVTPRSSGWGDRRELEFIIDNRQASNNVNPYSNASRTLSARGAGPGVKKR